MSIIQTITWKSLPIESLNLFGATFNATGTGQYDFGANTANQRQTVLELNERYLYLMERVSISATIAEGDYLRSIAVVPNFRFSFRNTPSGQGVYPRPLPAVNYKDNLEFSFWFKTQKKNDALLVSLGGILDQIPATVGISEIKLQLSLVIYQEENLEKITTMRDGTKQGIGSMYRTGL
jgi:hypothetical protein